MELREEQDAGIELFSLFDRVLDIIPRIPIPQVHAKGLPSALLLNFALALDITIPRNRKEALSLPYRPPL